jgi:hypothetical protein
MFPAGEETHCDEVSSIVASAALSLQLPFPMVRNPIGTVGRAFANRIDFHKGQRKFGVGEDKKTLRFCSIARNGIVPKKWIKIQIIERATFV